MRREPFDGTLEANSRAAPGEGSLRREETNERKKIAMEQTPWEAPARSDLPQRVVARLPVERATQHSHLRMLRLYPW